MSCPRSIIDFEFVKSSGGASGGGGWVGTAGSLGADLLKFIGSSCGGGSSGKIGSGGKG